MINSSTLINGEMRGFCYVLEASQTIKINGVKTAVICHKIGISSDTEADALGGRIKAMKTMHPSGEIVAMVSLHDRDFAVMFEKGIHHSISNERMSKNNSKCEWFIGKNTSVVVETMKEFWGTSIMMDEIMEF